MSSLFHSGPTGKQKAFQTQQSELLAKQEAEAQQRKIEIGDAERARRAALKARGSGRSLLLFGSELGTDAGPSAPKDTLGG